MELLLDNEQAAGATAIAAELLEDCAEGAIKEGAYALDLALEEAGCCGVRAIELADADLAGVRWALSAYEGRHRSRVGPRERRAIDALRGAMAPGVHRLAEAPGRRDHAGLVA